MKQAFKNKYVWLCATLLTLALSIYFFHIHVERRALVVSTLEKCSNVSMKTVPPSWTSKLPKIINDYLQPLYPVNLTFTQADDYVSIFNDDEKKTEISFSRFYELAGELKSVREIIVSASSSEGEELQLSNIDPLFENEKLTKIELDCDRVKLSRVFYPSTLKEIHIKCRDITDNFYETVSHCKSLKKLHISTTDYVTPENLEHLAGLSNLEILSIDGLMCNEGELSFLKNLTSLKILNLRYNEELLTESDIRSSAELPGELEMKESLHFLKNHLKLEEMDTTVVLTKENLRLLNSYSHIPTARYNFDSVMDDEYIALLDKFINKMSGLQTHLKQGLLKKMNIGYQGGVTNKSTGFFKRNRVPHLNLKGTAITSLKDLALDYCRTINFPKNGNFDGVFEILNAPEYEMLDFSDVPISGEQLKTLLTQTHPQILYLSGNHYTEKEVETVMAAFKRQPKAIMKVSFGNWDIPKSKRNAFLDRVHQWGMSVVYSSHLDKEFVLPNWHIQVTRKIIHDKEGSLKSLSFIFPRLKTIVLGGKKADVEEWKSFVNLKAFDSLYLESEQSGKALNDSGIIKKLENFDIKANLDSPVKLTDNIEKTTVVLEGQNLSEIIDLSQGCPHKLILQGTGSLNLDIFAHAGNLRELVISPEIEISGAFPSLAGVKLLKCLSPMNPDSLSSIKNLPNLTILAANCRNVNAGILKVWSTLGELKTIDISKARLADNDLVALSSFPKLQVLELPAFESVTPAVMSTLKKITPLVKVNFIGTAIYPKEVKEYNMPGHWDYEL